MTTTARIPTEHQIQNDILRRFATIEGIRLWRINTGVLLTPDGRRMVRTAPTGFPDPCGILPRGRAWFVEVKRPAAGGAGGAGGSRAGRPTIEQAAFARMCTRMGALYVLATSCDDVERVLRIEGYGEWLHAKAEVKP